MNRYLKLFNVIALFLLLSPLSAEKYAGELFMMGAGVRNIALGRTGLTDQNSSSKAYWNASLLAKQIGSDYELMHAEDFAGNLKYDVFSANIGHKANIGLVISRIAIDNISLTAIPNPDSLPSNDNRPYAYKKISNADYIINLGFGRELSNQFLIGISPKLVYRNIDEESAYGFGADLSATYFYSDDLVLACRLRDFFSTQLFYQNGTHEIVNPGLDLEAYYSLILPKLDKQLNLFLNTELNFENIDAGSSLSVGVMSADLHAGLELLLTQSVSIYTGYDIDNLTAGFTLNYRLFNVNYSFEQDTELSNSHRISLGLKL